MCGSSRLAAWVVQCLNVSCWVLRMVLVAVETECTLSLSFVDADLLIWTMNVQR